MQPVKPTIYEIWLECPGYSLYEVSNFGRVRRSRDGLPMATSMNKAGALKLSLCTVDGERITEPVQNLVASAFVPKPEAEAWGHEYIHCDYVLHKDRDKTNNRAWNLVWRTKRHIMLYHEQFKNLPEGAYTGPVVNLTWDVVYNTVYEAAVEEGVLMEEILRCMETDRGNYEYGTYGVLPEMCIFQRYGR